MKLAPSGTPNMGTYLHPRCKCAQSSGAREMHYPQVEKLSLRKHQRQTDDGFPAAYELPPFDLAQLRQSIKHAARIYPSLLEKSKTAHHLKFAGGDSHLSSAATQAVLFTSFNSAYVDLYLNWACHARQHSLKHMVWAQDRTTAALLSSTSVSLPAFLGGRERDNRSYASLFYSAHMSDAFGVVPWSTSFRSKGFNKITFFKLSAVRIILQAGWDAWFCDVDVVFRRDPWPLFSRASLLSSAPGPARGVVPSKDGAPHKRLRYVQSRSWCDYEYAANSQCSDQEQGATANDASAEGNTGFHFFRRGKQALGFLDDVLKLASAQPDMDDQYLLWATVRARRKAGTAIFARVNSSQAIQSWEQSVSTQIGSQDDVFRYCLLPRRTHVNGQCFDRALAPDRWLDAAVIHANWLTGPRRKAEKLARNGLWLLNGQHDAHSCTAFMSNLVMHASGWRGWAAWL